MRIAQVSPLFEAVPPRLYGGTERVVSYLTEELVNQGHDVTLFSSGDSVTKAKHVSCIDKGLRLSPEIRDVVAPHILQLQTVLDQIANFDIVHFHFDHLHFPSMLERGIAHVTTLHGRLDLQELQPLFRRFCALPMVSISNNQRKPLPQANWLATVYHGLPRNLYSLGHGQGGYLAFLGRVSPEKRLDRAIEIAKRMGLPIRIAAKIDRADEEYFESHIKSLMDHPLVEFVGEIGESEKQRFLGEALCLLFPIAWSEPFGIVMIEAMACGTPVLAWPNGSVPEVVDDGGTGFIASSLDEAVSTLERNLPSFNRQLCRQIFESRFLADQMASDYVRIYEEVVAYGVVTPRSANY